MSHFTVTVVCPKEEAHDVDAYVTKALAPYDENNEWFREGSHWDWWVIGGRWTGYFKCMPGTGAILSEPGLMTDPARSGYADIIPQGAVDWEGMMFDGAQEARADWARAAASGKPVSYMATYTSEEEYVALHSSIATHALVDKEGAWHESGSMGWFGVTTGEMDRDEWNRQYVEYVGSCDPTDILVLVDCHV